MLLKKNFLGNSKCAYIIKASSFRAWRTGNQRKEYASYTNKKSMVYLRYSECVSPLHTDIPTKKWFIVCLCFLGSVLALPIGWY